MSLNLRRIAVLIGLFCSLLAGASCRCSSGDGRQVLSVYAASSLREVFQELGHQFELAHPEVDVRITFAGSQVLRLQLEQGARADVYASADRRHMAALAELGLLEQSEWLISNELVVIVPASNPTQIHEFSQLDRASKLIVGSPSVPVGGYTRRLFDRAGAQLGVGFASRLRSQIVSQETNVRLVRAKVELGEADAAIVYRTDGLASQRVKMVEIPRALNVRADYVVGRLKASARGREASQFVEYLHSKLGLEVFARHGFRGAQP